MTALANFDAAAFLDEDWQRQPRLIKHAVPNFSNPLAPEELAGLALEDGVEARMVVRHNDCYVLDSGPFAADSFSGTDPWTLLVQGVDHHVAEVAELRKLVDFLPSWRFDDIMVSYAIDGGGVGPHYDNYDVFLLQGLGARRWLLGQSCDGSETLLPGDDLRILADFDTSGEYLLEPGDILYVPPRLAHWGIAQGHSMTYSLGFRAPRVNDVLGRWIDALLENVDPELFYADPVPLSRTAPGEIGVSSYAGALAQLQQAIAATPVSPDWFGELVTEPGTEALSAEVSTSPGAILRLAPWARLAWRRGGDRLAVYANGATLETDPELQPLLEGLCAGGAVEVDCDEARRAVLLELAELGCLQDG